METQPSHTPPPPKVLHVGNPSNVAAELRDALRTMRLADSVVFETHNNRLQFDEDVRFTWDWNASLKQRLERHVSYIFLMKSLLDEADVLHMHTSGRVVLASQRWALRKGIRVIRHFHGAEVRAGGVEEEAELANAIFVSTPDLIHYLPDSKLAEKAMWVPVPRTFPNQPREPRTRGPVRVVHSYLAKASYAHVFGTEVVRKAVAKLRKEGLDVFLDEVTGVTHGEALARYSEADIAVDKLRIGWYGAFGVECLSLGIPVLAGIARDLEKYRPPVLSVSEENLAELLRPLVEDVEYRRKTSAKLFVRARELHDAPTVAARVGKVYAELLE